MTHFQAHGAMGGADYTQQLESAPTATRVRMMREFVADCLRETRERLTILDVGCADGGICAPFAGRADLHGLDVNDDFRKAALANGMKAQRIDFERDRFPHPDRTVDLVVCGETIEHVVNTDWFMSEINRVTKPGAAAVFSIPNINQAISIPMMLLLDRPPRYAARFRAPHVRDFTFRTMKECFTAFGFDVRKALGTGLYVPGLRRHVLRGPSRRFPRLSAEVVFLLRKTRDVTYDPAKTVQI
jgi:2-polyprenyl-3-methyl-5-hydroxy-6-metoxy-1,4-benzoquinol methylase